MERKYVLNRMYVQRKVNEPYRECYVLEDEIGEREEWDVTRRLVQRLRLKEGVFVYVDSEDNTYRVTKPRSKTNYTRQIVDDYCVVDVETTGLFTYSDEIIEIAMLRVRDNQIVDRYSQLIKPQRKRIPYEITDLTGITNEMVADMPSINDVKDEVLSFIGNDVIVGHNSSFDVRFLKTGLKVYLPNPYVCTYQFSRKVYSEYKSHRLQDLSKWLRLSKSTHRALADCIATKELYDAIKQRMQENGWSVDDLWCSPRIEPEEKFHKGKNEYLGMTQIQKDGRFAKIVRYRNYNDIDVEYEDGFTVNTTVKKWKDGRVLRMETSETSVIDITPRREIKTVGVINYNCGFGEKRTCDNSCEFYNTCTRALFRGKL